MNYQDAAILDAEELEEDVEPCRACPGDAFWMGSLGFKDYYRCRSCGFQFGVTPQQLGEMNI